MLLNWSNISRSKCGTYCYGLDKILFSFFICDISVYARGIYIQACTAYIYECLPLPSGSRPCHSIIKVRPWKRDDGFNYRHQSEIGGEFVFLTTGWDGMLIAVRSYLPRQRFSHHISRHASRSLKVHRRATI